MKTAALYARVSTELQEKEETIQSQLQALIDFVKEQGDWIIPQQHIFTDDGYSGDLLVRPALDALRDAAKTNAFEIVLIHSPDRLARKYAYQELIIDELRDLGVEVVFLNRPKAITDEDQIFQGFQGLFAEYERAKIRERTRRGRRYIAQQGKLVGHTPRYGWSYTPKTKTRRGYYTVDEKEAEVMRTTFSWLADGLSLRGVIKKLFESGIKSPTGKERWAKSTLSRLVRDEAYIGQMYYGKTITVVPKNPRNKGYRRTKKTSRTYRPKEEWIPVPVPAIIDEDTFWGVQEQLERNRQFSPRNAKNGYLLRGLLVCGECSLKFASDIKKGRRRYRCTNRLKRYPLPKNCSASSVSADKIEPVVWDSVCELIKDPTLIADQLEKVRQKLRSRKPLGGEKIDVIEKRLEETKEEENRLIEAYSKKVITLQQLKERVGELEKERQGLNKRKEELASAVKEEGLMDLNLVQIKDYSRYVGERIEAFSFEEKQKFLRLLVDEILVKGKDLTIRGMIPVDNYPKDQVRDQNVGVLRPIPQYRWSSRQSG